MPATRRPASAIRQAIVEAAIRLLAERGVDGLTHRAVAQAADVSLSSTTYHFASKEAIVSAALRYVVDLDLQRLHESAAALLASDGAADTEMLVDLLLREVTTGGSITIRAQYHLQIEAAEHAELQPLIRTWAQAVIDRVADVLVKFGSSDPKLDAQLVVAATDGLRLKSLAVPDDVAVRAALSHLIGIIIAGPRQAAGPS